MSVQVRISTTTNLPKLFSNLPKPFNKHRQQQTGELDTNNSSQPLHEDNISLGEPSTIIPRVSEDGFACSLRSGPTCSIASASVWSIADSDGSVTPPHDVRTMISDIVDDLQVIGSDTNDSDGSSSHYIYRWPKIERVTDVDIQLRAYRTGLNENYAAINRTVGDLKATLLGAMKRSCSPQARIGFLPSNTHSEFICEANVYKELKRAQSFLFRKNRIRSDQDLHDDARMICNVTLGSTDGTATYKKIFAILVLIGKPLEIRHFMRETVCDSDLPLNKLVKRKGRQRNRLELSRTSEEESALTCFQYLTDGQVEKFEELQWVMLSPFMNGPQAEEKKLFHYVFKDDMILPFTDWEEGGSLGGHSQVYRVRIHNSHHSFPSSHHEVQYYAVKELRSRDEEDFNREVNLLNSFSGTHNHLVSLLGAYEQHNKFHLVFPWANSNLLQFWKEYRKQPEVDKATVFWVAKQCEGISKGLYAIHHHQTITNLSINLIHNPCFTSQTGQRPSINPSTPDEPTFSTICTFSGRHVDIKPENILWFDDAGDSSSVTDPVKGTLKISDFGTCGFARQGGSHRLPISLTYRPPEVELDQPITVAYEMWALGAVFLEFITWCLGGWKYVEEFTDLRCLKDQNSKWGSTMETDVFFIIIKQGNTQRAEVKREVTKFIRDLHLHEKCTEYFHDFLILIETRMLIIQPSEPFDFDRSEVRRISCWNLHRELSKFYHKCHYEEGYATTPTPRDVPIAPRLD